MNNINPKCENGQQHPFVNAENKYFLCCWLAAHRDLKNLEEFFADPNWLNKIDLTNYSLEEVETYYQKVRLSWNSQNCLSTCKEYCSNINSNDARKILI